MKCPCCGKEMAIFEKEQLRYLPMSIVRKSILRLLCEHVEGLNMEQILRHIYSKRRPKTACSTLRNLISTMRPMLEPYGWTIPRAYCEEGRPGIYRLERVDEVAP